MTVWRVMLNLSVSLLPINGIAGIDASGFDHSHASKHYTKRAKLTIQQLKVTLLVDSKGNVVLDLHVTTTREHNSQIAPSLIKRNQRLSTSCSVTKATTTRKSDGLPVNTRFAH